MPTHWPECDDLIVVCNPMIADAARVLCDGERHPDAAQSSCLGAYFDPNRSVAATFQALPGASFVVNGAAQASDSALTTASAEMKWINGWSVAATFEGEFSNVTHSYAGKGVVR